MSEPAAPQPAAPAAAPPANDVLTWRPSPPEKDEGQPQRPVRVWLRVAIGLGVLLGILVAAGIISSMAFGQRAKQERADLEARLDETDPEWRLEQIEQGREQIPEEENSARVVVPVGAMLKSWPPMELYALFQDLPSDRQLDPVQEARLEAEMRALDPVVLTARRLADMPRGRHRLEWAYNPYATLLPDHQQTRTVGALLEFDVKWLAHKGDADGAIRSCRALINAARSLGDEQLMISALIRCAVLALGGNAIERVLAQGTPGDRELALLQALLAQENKHPTMRNAYRGERAAAYDLISKMADGRIRTDEADAMLDGNERSEWWQRIGRGVGRRDPVTSLKLMTRLVEISELPESEQPEAERALDRQMKQLGRDAAYTRLVAPAVVNFGRAIRRKTALIRCLLVLVAVERYRLAHKRWPADLAALKPALLEEIPTDPYDGKPLRYRPTADGVVVYSIGEDASDDGGNVVRGKPNEKGVDQGYRLWDASKRRQPSLELGPPPEVVEGEP